MPSLYLDEFADAQALRRRISSAFLGKGWNIVGDFGSAEVALLDSAAVSELVVGAAREAATRVLVLVWGAHDPAFATGPVQQADGIVDRDDPAEDWLRAADEVLSGFGWISPPLVPRFRAATASAPGPATSGNDTWQGVLSSAEYEIARLVVRGMSNAEIAEERWVREGTIKQQLSSIYRKLGIRGRPALISLGYRKKRQLSLFLSLVGNG